MKQRGFRYCSTCKKKLQKWGKTPAGTQRWRCPNCVSTQVKSRPDLSRAFTLERFVSWLLSKQSQAELKLPDGVTDRAWRDQIAWCWSVAPPSVLSGEIHHAVIVDGIRVGGRICLIARTNKFVIAWLWVERENSESWVKLFSSLPTPTYVVCDGQKGLLTPAGRW